MLWPLKNTNGQLAIPALAGLLVRIASASGQPIVSLQMLKNVDMACISALLLKQNAAGNPSHVHQSA